MDSVKFGNLAVSKIILGGNPFSGFSHQNPDMDREMVRYFTVANIKKTMAQAEALGITGFLGRVDKHIRRTLLEYWDEGGKIQWMAGARRTQRSEDGFCLRRAALASTGCRLHWRFPEG